MGIKIKGGVYDCKQCVCVTSKMMMRSKYLVCNDHDDDDDDYDGDDDHHDYPHHDDGKHCVSRARAR